MYIIQNSITNEYYASAFASNFTPNIIDAEKFDNKNQVYHIIDNIKTIKSEFYIILEIR